MAGIAGTVVVAGLLVIGARELGLTGDDDVATAPIESAQTLPAFDGDDPQPTLLVATFDETDGEGSASQVVLFGDDPEGGSIVFVPSTTVAEIPGYGPLQLGRALGLGDTPLLELTVDNLLGIDTDGAVAVSRQGWAVFFEQFGGLELDVPRALTATSADGERRVRFERGEQFLDGERVAEYLTFAAAGESELDRLPRVQQVLEALLDAVAEDPGRLEQVFQDGAAMLDTPEPARLRDMLLALADARTQDQLDVRTLPVTPIGAGEQGSYRLDESRVTALVDERFDASRPVEGQTAGRRLQILNGNGEPGIGQDVAALLQPGGYRVVLTRNADRFDYDTTRIVVHVDDPDQLALARDVRDRLGVGVVEISETPGRVADITVVVGADFPP